jgi:hypothetical protein
VASIQRKLTVHNRVGIAAWALDTGHAAAGRWCPRWSRAARGVCRSARFSRAEIGSATGGVREPGGTGSRRRLPLSTNPAFGNAYMAAVRPFRHLIVYPATMRQAQELWSHARQSEPGRPASVAPKTLRR